MTKLLVVFGITGEQGGSVANHFLSIPGWNTRGITRNPSSTLSLSWSQKGIQLVYADLNDLSTLPTALQGATAIFAVTNFWEPFYNPNTASLLKEGQNTNQYCYEQEIQQVKNIADAAAHVAALERLVLSSSCDVSKWSGGKYSWVYHFDSKARGEVYLRENYLELAGKTSVIHIGSYMNNWKENLHFRKAGDGTVRLATLKGTSEKPRPQIETARDTGALVHAALEAPAGKRILGVGSSISWEDQFRTWCRIHGLEYGGFDEVTLEQFEMFMPIPGLGREIGEMMLFEDEFRYCGGEKGVVFPEDLGVSCTMTS
ncbi:putative NAD dependent epimerase/dehydratase [Amylocarpus encephaloides]|uniref:NAD dependent epimerase/dehydratase n=1 Tax=Amylocarpus encephaloides TaxID=45428 RepID=A0A9P7Y7G4_9HELO|nr:putative NAD dependent epimerase/dehydratase [Amylocarpus encephaloides]